VGREQADFLVRQLDGRIPDTVQRFPGDANGSRERAPATSATALAQ
jgi:hypothetical protein